jgi:cell division protein FtsI/penicillin-binding protein 2
MRSGTGGLIAGATEVFQPAVDGSDLVLTINRSLQFEACKALQEAVAKWQASGGAVVVMDPKTGAVLAMCSNPTFDPNSYGDVESAAQYDNHALLPYEPGSVVKPITMSAAIDAGAVNPSTTFTHPGVEEIGGFKIKNAQEKKWGLQTMAGVLQHSINTGMVFAMRKLGHENLARYFDSFNLGKPTEVGMAGDRAGDISALKKPGEIYAATASFGQGITATPLQLAAAYSAMANGGKLMKPYVVAEVIEPDGTSKPTQPTVIRQVLKPAAAGAIKAMLAGVINTAPVRVALIPGFWVAGKTGTAQISDPHGGYYSDRTNHTFAGFAPVTDPAVVTIAKLETPKVAWAEGSAGPLFQQVTAAALRLLRVQPDNP